MADAAVARLSQGTKVYAEGGHDRVFFQTFGAMPGEQLRKAYACYLFTSSGPVIGTLSGAWVYTYIRFEEAPATKDTQRLSSFKLRRMQSQSALAADEFDTV